MVYWESRYREDSGYTYRANDKRLAINVDENIAVGILCAIMLAADAAEWTAHTDDPANPDVKMTLTVYVEGSRFTHAHVYEAVRMTE